MTMTPDALAEIWPKLAQLINARDFAAAVEKVLPHLPQEERLAFLTKASHIHPFYVPTLNEGDRNALAIGEMQLAQVVLQARLSAAVTQTPRILFACPPKSASTFLSQALCHALSAPLVSLATTCISPASSSQMGANMREQELDELAILKRCVSSAGFVAQHHVRATPFLHKQASLYRIRPVVSSRNIFDSLVSADDMMMAGRAKHLDAAANDLFFNDSMPGRYHLMPFEERMALLCERYGYWYVQFHASWRALDASETAKPVWIVYERDVLGDQGVLAERIVRELDIPQLTVDGLLAGFKEALGEKTRFNRGVAGRGQAIPAPVRERILSIIASFEPDVDMSALTLEAEESADAA